MGRLNPRIRQSGCRTTMAASEAAAAMAARWPSGEGGGSVGSALAWFDAPHRPGVSDHLVDPEAAPAGGQQRGMPRRPTPPAARRLKPADQLVAAGGYRPGQQLTPRAARRERRPAAAAAAAALPEPSPEPEYRGGLLGAAPVALSARVGSEIVAGGSLELLQRVVEQQDKEIRAMRGESKSAAQQSSLVSSLEERLRRAEASEMATTHRFKLLEDQLALAATAARQRQTQVDNELQNIQRTLVAANQQMSDAAGQRRDLHSDVEGVHDKLAERVEKYATAITEQIHRGDEERLKLESSTKSLLQGVETTVSDKMRNIENMMLPELDRKMADAVGGVARKLDDGLARLATALREVDMLRNQGDAHVRKDVGAVGQLVQKGLLQLKAEAERQKAAVTAVVKAEVQNRLLNLEGLKGEVEAQRLEIQAENEAGLQELDEQLRALITEQVEMVANEAREAKTEAETTREMLIQEAATLREEFAAGDHALMTEWQRLMGIEHNKLLAQLDRTRQELRAESKTREEEVRQLNEKVGETNSTLEAGLAELRSSLDTAEGGLKTALEEATVKLGEADEELRTKLTADVERLEKEQQQIEAELGKRLGSEVAKLEGQISTNAEVLAEHGVRLDAVEDLVEEHHLEMVKGFDKHEADVAEKLLALQEETAETLFGFREHLDTELNTVNDEAEKNQEKNAKAIEECKSGLLAELASASERIVTQLGESEERMLANAASTTEAMLALEQEMVSAGELVAEEFDKRAGATAAHVDEVATELRERMMSMRQSVTKTEERGVRANADTLAAVVELRSSLAGARTEQVALDAQLALLRDRLAEAEEEVAEVKTHQSQHQSKLFEMQQRKQESDEASDEEPDGIPQELLDELDLIVGRRVEKRAEPWEDRLAEYEQTARLSATRLQERIQRANGRCSECELAIAAMGDDTEDMRQAIEAQQENMGSHSEFMAAQDERITAHEGRTAVAEEGIAKLRGRADAHEQRADTLLEQAGKMGERVTSLDDRVTSLERQDYRTIEALGGLDSRTEKLEQQRTDLQALADTAVEERTQAAQQVEALQQRIDASDLRHQATEDSVEAVQERVRESEETVVGLQSHAEEMEARQQDADDRVNAGISECSEKLEALEEQLVQQAQQAEASETGTEMDSALVERLEELGSKLTEATDRIEAVNQDALSARSSLLDKIAEGKRGVEELQKKCTAAADDVATIQNTLQECVSADVLDAAVESLRSAAEEQNAELDELQAGQRDAETKARDMDTTLRQVNDTLQRHEDSMAVREEVEGTKF